MCLIYFKNINSHLLKTWLFVLLLIFHSSNLLAHPMPNSLVQVALHQTKVVMNVKLPIGEFEVAFGKELDTNVTQLVYQNKEAIITYITNHIKIIDEKNNSWTKTVTNVYVDSTHNDVNGSYLEVAATIEFNAPKEIKANRRLTLLYDVIIHQVVTHNALVYITQDWDNGINNENQKQIGVISLDTKNNVVQPFIINLEKGSSFIGFKSMVILGIQHIAEGTDHLLFLLVLLFTAPLLVVNKQWQGFGGNRYSFIRILKIITAFTIGHSLTLIFGALGWLQLPQAPVEVLIAVSILVTAIHCIKPIFYGKEILIAAGFGIIHGSAFSTVLSNLCLQGKELVLSILGFNAGIEIMQLIVIIIVLPILIYSSKQSSYKYIRITGATAAGLAAIYWIIQRV